MNKECFLHVRYSQRREMFVMYRPIVVMYIKYVREEEQKIRRTEVMFRMQMQSVITRITYFK